MWFFPKVLLLFSVVYLCGWELTHMQKVQLIICKKDIQSASFLYLHDFWKTKKKLFSAFRRKPLYCSFVARYVLGSIILVRVTVVPLCLIENSLCVHVCLCVRERPSNTTVSHFQVWLTSFASNKQIHVFIFPILFASSIQSLFRLKFSQLNCLTKVS